MSEQIPERVRWAVDVLDPQPGDRLLEIGPGPGVAVQLIAPLLRDGRITAIDRSEVAVRRTTARNQPHVSAGKVLVQRCSFEQFDDRAGQFDKIYAINVNLFWVREANDELRKAMRLLEPGGALFIFYETPGVSKARRIAQRLKPKLTGAGFDVDVNNHGSLLCVLARH